MLTVSLMKRETQLCHFIKMLLVELADQLQSQSIFRLNSSDKDQKSSLFLLDILLQGLREEGGFLWENVLIGSQMYPLCEHM